MQERSILPETKRQGKVILGMTISLDGFINDRNGSLDSLYPDLSELRETEVFQEILETTGAVVLGKNAYAMGDPDWFANNYEFQTPIIVLTHEVPKRKPKETDKLKFTFVTDGIESAIQKAKSAAGNKNVVVIGGASTAQQCLKAGLADELHMDIMPILLCENGGLRMFEHLGSAVIQLEKIDTTEYLKRTRIRFRVAKT